VLLDSLSAYVPRIAQPETAAEALEQLTMIAIEFDCAVLFLHHFLKALARSVDAAIGGASAVQRIARSIHVFGAEPVDPLALLVRKVLGDTADEDAAVRILVSDVNARSMRAVNYAQTLGIADTRAVHFAFSREDGRAISADWAAHGPRVPLDLDDAPYRDFGPPLLSYLRGLTADEDTAVLVIMPELVVRGWRRILHNERALYVKRLLLFEPGIILASVPYQLLR